MADISQETASLKEIKDVLDELNSIAHVFRQQITVVKLMVDDIGIQRRNETRRKPHATPPSKADDSKEPKDKDQADLTGTGNSTTKPTNMDKKPLDGRDLDGVDENLEDTEFMYKHMLTALERRLGDIESLDTKAHRVYKDVRILSSHGFFARKRLTLTSFAISSILSRSRRAYPRRCLRGRRLRTRRGRDKPSCYSPL